jgi:hypothetical protein
MHGNSEINFCSGVAWHPPTDVCHDNSEHYRHIKVFAALPRLSLPFVSCIQSDRFRYSRVYLQLASFVIDSDICVYTCNNQYVLHTANTTVAGLL